MKKKYRKHFKHQIKKLKIKARTNYPTQTRTFQPIQNKLFYINDWRKLTENINTLIYI